MKVDKVITVVEVLITDIFHLFNPRETGKKGPCRPDQNGPGGPDGKAPLKPDCKGPWGPDCNGPMGPDGKAPVGQFAAEQICTPGNLHPKSKG